VEIYALVGPSGTGKSHRAGVVANQLDIPAIIDDGLLIYNNQIIAGMSAKRQATRIAAIKAALFMDEHRAQEIKKAIVETKPDKILILGTSTDMVERIARRLELPAPQKIMFIEEYASEKEIRKARYLRNHFNKHVIPAPTMEVKKSFPGTLIDSFQIFLKEKESPGKKKWLEQSIVRPTFTQMGKLTIAERAISTIADLAALSVPGVVSTSRTAVKVEQEGIITINISAAVVYGFPLHKVAETIQRQITQAMDKICALQVKAVNVTIKELVFPEETN